MRQKSLLITLCFLSACAHMGDNLVELRTKKIEGDGFSQALAKEYLAYAESRLEEQHPLRANYFAHKGLTALEKGDVPLEDNSALVESKEALTAVLTPDIKDIAPAKAARAQLLFDCWAEKEKGVCKESFAEALADLQMIADALVHGEDNRFVVHFAAKSAELPREALAMVDVVAKRVAGYGEYQVEITPVARKGKYTGKRLLALEKELIARGVNAGRIHSHRKATGREVLLSIDDEDRLSDNVVLSIQTYGQPVEATTP